MEVFLREAHRAAVQAASGVCSRPSDCSFLEATLETALVSHLTGQSTTAQQRRRFNLAGYKPSPYGVDIAWAPSDGALVGIEVKVTDVLDALFDVVKLATAVAQDRFLLGICAVAATASQWSRGGPMTTLATDVERWQLRTTEELVAGPARRAVIVERGPRPVTVPSTFETFALSGIPMPQAATHTLRLVGVRATLGAPPVSLG